MSYDPERMPSKSMKKLGGDRTSWSWWLEVREPLDEIGSSKRIGAIRIFGNIDGHLAARLEETTELG